MAGTFFVRIAGIVHGPFDSMQVKRLAATGKIHQHHELSRDRRRWISAQNVRGLDFGRLPRKARDDSPPKSNYEPLPTANGNGAHTHHAAATDARPAAGALGSLLAAAAQPAGEVATISHVQPPEIRPAAATRLTLNLAACPDCGQFVSLRAIDCPHCGGPVRQLSAPAPAPRHRLLRMMSSAYAALGVLLLLAAAGSTVAMAYFAIQSQLGVAAVALVALPACITAAVSCFIVSESIQVFLQIEQNTRASRLAVTHRGLSEVRG